MVAKEKKPGLAACSFGFFSSHTDMTGTKVLDRKYDAIMEKPTASDRGTNKARVAPLMKNAGMKTARMQSIANSRGSAVSAVASYAARATDFPAANCVWMFSMVTVASSTR